MNVRTPGHSEMVYVPPEVTEQECRTCHAVKPLADFELRNDSGKHRPDCRECRAANEAARRYGLTREDVDALHESQGGLCAICGCDGAKHATFTRLVIDHCHETEKVRGLLCGPCNSAIGLLKDSPEIALAAAAYLQKHK